jgi:hypothetical protein
MFKLDALSPKYRIRNTVGGGEIAKARTVSELTRANMAEFPCENLTTEEAKQVFEAFRSLVADVKELEKEHMRAQLAYFVGWLEGYEAKTQEKLEDIKKATEGKGGAPQSSLTDGERYSFEFLKRALDKGEAALLRVKNKVTGEERAVAAHVSFDSESESYMLCPLAEFIKDIEAYSKVWTPED